MSITTQHGYLVLADISGYTSFVAKTELEHSHEIITELLELLVEKIKPAMTISKLEGDAVFAYADEKRIPHGDTLVSFLESVYAAFRDKLISMRRKTTCTCSACQNISTLDLKFIAHHGDYVIQNVATIHELVGSDVNLLHRLSKNHVAEATGWRAYMLFTQSCLESLGLKMEDAHLQTEEYEHLGEIQTHNVDLHKRYQTLKEEKRTFISKEEADVTFEMDVPVPPHIVWEWTQDPAKRNQWSSGVTWSAGNRPNGRRGKGASNHCAHGRGVSTETVLDWRPFEYATTESHENGKITVADTTFYEPLSDGGTRFRYHMRLHMLPLPQFLRRWAGRLVFKHVIKMDSMFKKAAQLAGEEYEQIKTNGA